jgi:hypothetical protein
MSSIKTSDQQSPPAAHGGTAGSPGALGWLVALWGVVGVLWLLSSACLRLYAHVVIAFEMGLSAHHWLVLVPWTVFMAYSEGYKGFQKAFSPRVAARALWLRQHPGLVRGVLAPAFCMGFFGATRKRKLVTWCLTVGIICLVLLVGQLPQPWRGVVDVGVVVGLAWGALALLVFALKGFVLGEDVADPELAPSLLAAQPKQGFQSASAAGSRQ